MSASGSDTVRGWARVPALSLLCATAAACGSAHPPSDAGSADAHVIDTPAPADAPSSMDAASSDDATTALDVSGGPSPDAAEGTDAFVCRPPGVICTFGKDCCSHACLLDGSGGDGTCL